jgi:hypothetical protein
LLARLELGFQLQPAILSRLSPFLKDLLNAILEQLPSVSSALRGEKQDNRRACDCPKKQPACKP